MTRVSVVIPTLNEALRISSCLAQFDNLPGNWDLIVADGGSTDDTVRLAESHGARVVAGPSGRGPQQNIGAAHAEGEVLLFLHADVFLPVDACAQIEALLTDPSVIAGAFRVRHQAERWRSTWKRHLLRVADWRSRYTRRPYGDQGIFLRKTDFEAAGGFPSWPLMEEVHLARDLARQGTIRVLRSEVQVSGRRFEAGLIRAFLCMNTFPLLDRWGVSPRLLSLLYGHPR